MAQQEQLHNNIFLVSILLLIIGCNAPNNYFAEKNILMNSIDTKDFKNQNGILLNNAKPFTGTIFTLFPNSLDTAIITNYIDGKENGEWKKYYAKNKIWEKRNYSNGKKEGEYIAYWENGKQQLQYLFEEDEYEGTCKEWNSNGLLVKEMHYKKGHEDGPQKWWYDNGKIKANYIIKDGRRYGLLGTKNCVNVSDSIFK